MKIPPVYSLTPKILELIVKIDSYRLFFNSLKIPLSVKDKIQRVTLLKSSIYSARIEGNPLTEEEIEASSDKQKKAEIFNIFKAAEYIEKNIRPRAKLTQKKILLLHKMVIKNISNQAGAIRKEMGAIFNQAGVVVYIAPPPGRITPLINQLLNYINDDREKFPLIKALLSHLIFEKIHPFIDGNGRVGRLLIFTILKLKNYDFGVFIPFEEYLNQHKSDYYYFLDTALKDASGYLIFMLEAFAAQLEKTKELILREVSRKETIFLPPRQEGILNIIKDHRLVSFDFIRRRFLKVPPRTLRYDLKKLAEKDYIIKIGKTRGSYYKAK